MMEWVQDEKGYIAGWSLFEHVEYVMERAYIHDNGGGGSWMVNVDGFFIGWAKDEAEARQMAMDRVAEVDARMVAPRPRHPYGRA